MRYQSQPAASIVTICPVLHPNKYYNIMLHLLAAECRDTHNDSQADPESALGITTAHGSLYSHS